MWTDYRVCCKNQYMIVIKTRNNNCTGSTFFQDAQLISGQEEKIITGDVVDVSEFLDLSTTMKVIVEGTPISTFSENLPTSMRQYLYQHINTSVVISEDLKVRSSEFLSNSLTIFNALQKINHPPAAKILLHVYCKERVCLNDLKCWEILLHLLPNLTDLKVVLFGQAETKKLFSDVCFKCSIKNINIESNQLSYRDYMEQEDYQKPTIIAFLNMLYEVDNRILDKYWSTYNSKVNVPVIITTYTENELRKIRNPLLEHFFMDVIYNGHNPFESLLQTSKLSEDAEVWKKNQFLFVFTRSPADTASWRSEYEANFKNGKCETGSATEDLQKEKIEITTDEKKLPISESDKVEQKESLEDTSKFEKNQQAENENLLKQDIDRLRQQNQIFLLIILILSLSLFFFIINNYLYSS